MVRCNAHFDALNRLGLTNEYDRRKHGQTFL